MNINKYLEKIISLILINILIFTPMMVFAESDNSSFINAYNNYNQPQQNNSNTGANGDAGVLPNKNNNSGEVPLIIPVPEKSTPPPKATVVNENTLTQASVDAQIQNSILATSYSSSSSSIAKQESGVTQVTVGAASCLGSNILSDAITKLVLDLVGNLVSKATDLIAFVPTAESGNAGANQRVEAAARSGAVISIFGVGLPLPSWDSIAYCIVNSMIVYIADSTIQWINTGFDGNPAFLNNPDQFFTDLANQEKRAFIQNLAYGANSAVCGAFKGAIVSSILSRYGKNRQGYNQQGYETGGYGQGQGGYGQGQSGFNGCPFDKNPVQFKAFLGGSFSEGGGWNTWFQLTQNPNNNPYDTYFRTNEALNSQVAAVKLSKTTELNWNNGYLSFRKCDTKQKDKSKCPVTTPGSVIQSKLESTLDLGTNRLVLADKFDQVVTTLVDYLITTAIDKTLETVNGN